MNSKFDPFPNARLFLFHIVIPGGGIELEPGKGGGKVKKRNTHKRLDRERFTTPFPHQAVLNNLIELLQLNFLNIYH